MNRKTVDDLEKLSKIKLTKEEKAKIIPEIDEIISYFNTLSEVDTKGVEPRSHSLDLTNVFREDEPKPSLSADEITSNAKTVDNYFVVPISVEGEDA